MSSEHAGTGVDQLLESARHNPADRRSLYATVLDEYASAASLQNDDILNLYNVMAYAMETGDDDLLTESRELVDAYFDEKRADFETLDELYDLKASHPVTPEQARQRYPEREPWLDRYEGFEESPSRTVYLYSVKDAIVPASEL